jgi:hypothetical protein
MWLHVPATGWRGKYFLPLTTGVTTVASPMIAMVAARTNHRTSISNCTDQALVAVAVLLHLCVENLSWDILLFVWCKFHFFCGTAVSCICITQTTACSCYRFHFIYMHAWCVSCNWGRRNAAWMCESVIVAFISLWKLKFLAYLLNVIQRFVMRIILYAKVVYFVFI